MLSHSSSSAFGLCWALWRRGRWGFLAIAAYFLLAFTLMTFVSGEKRTDDAVMLMIPTLAAFIFVFTTFAYGDTDFAARETGCPRHTLTLPAPAWAIVLWPMLLGGVAITAVWSALTLIILRPGGLDAPLLWPAALLVGLLASTQAAVLWPYGFRYARMIVFLLVGVGFLAVGAIPVELGAPRWVLVPLSLSIAVVAYFLACRGLTLARRGDGTRWRWLEGMIRVFERGLRRQPPLESPTDAQGWMEISRNALMVPAQVLAICLIFTVCVFFMRRIEKPGSILVGDRVVTMNPFAMLAGMALALPLLMSAFTGNVMGKVDAWSKELAVGSFLGVRPISSTDIVACKLRAAWWVTATCWGIVLVMIPIWAMLTPHYSRPVIDRIFGNPISIGRVVTAAVLLALLVSATWKLLAASLWVTLFGRKWITIGFPMTMMLGLMVMSPTGHWFYRHPEQRIALQNWITDHLPWLLLAVLCLKGIASAWIVRELLRRNLVDRSRVMGWVETWIAVSGVLCLPVWWVLPWQGVKAVPLLLTCMLVVPFTRLALAPLALHVNRHR